MPEGSDRNHDRELGLNTETESPRKFHLYNNLPPELRIQIIEEFLKDFNSDLKTQEGSPIPRLAPYAAIHSEWQHEAERLPQLFGSLRLSVEDLPTFHRLLNKHRRDALSEVTIRITITGEVIDSARKMHPEGSGASRAAIASAARRFIMDSFVRILVSVDSARCMSSKGILSKNVKGSGLGLVVQIAGARQNLQRGEAPSSFWNVPWIDGTNEAISTNFSHLPLAPSIRLFSGTEIGFTGFVATTSSLVSLLGRMPNLEQASVAFSPEIGVDDKNNAVARVTFPTPELCPRLKSLRIPDYGPRDGTRMNNALAQWTTYWSKSIRRLHIMCLNDSVPGFLRTFVKRHNRPHVNARPHLQLLTMRGMSSTSQFPPPQPDPFTVADGPVSTLSALAVALESLPEIGYVMIDLVVYARVSGNRSKCTITIRLDLRSRGGQPTLVIYRYSSPTACKINGEDLTFQAWMPLIKGPMQGAAAEVKDAVRRLRGLDLEVVWPETLEKQQDSWNGKCP